MQWVTLGPWFQHQDGLCRDEKEENKSMGRHCTLEKGTGKLTGNWNVFICKRQHIMHPWFTDRFGKFAHSSCVPVTFLQTVHQFTNTLLSCVLVDLFAVKFCCLFYTSFLILHLPFSSFFQISWISIRNNHIYWTITWVIFLQARSAELTVHFWPMCGNFMFFVSEKMIGVLLGHVRNPEHPPEVMHLACKFLYLITKVCWSSLRDGLRTSVSIVSYLHMKAVPWIGSVFSLAEWKKSWLSWRSPYNPSTIKDFCFCRRADTKWSWGWCHMKWQT